MTKATKGDCRGCREDFYNGKNGLGITECAYLKTAVMKKKWRLGWWSNPTEPGALQEVRVPSCYNQQGTAAYMDKLPSNAVKPIRLKRAPR